MPGRLVAVRPEGHVYGVVCQQQTRPLDMLLRIELNIACARGCYGDRTIQSFLAGLEIERMEIERGTAILEDIRNDV